MMHTPQPTTTGIRVGAGLSTHTDGLTAARAALDEALAGFAGPPDLLLLFVAPQYEGELEEVVRYANVRADGATLLGCSASGIIGGSREVEDAPAIADSRSPVRMTTPSSKGWTSSRRPTNSRWCSCSPTRSHFRLTCSWST